MLSLCKVYFVVFFSIAYSEGKVKKNEKVLPIEVVLNSNNHGKIPVPDATFLENKAIELKILPDDSKDGKKVDLIIEATKKIQATEARIDRNSPTFNSEFNLKKEPPGNPKTELKIKRNWDASRQDTHIHHPSPGTELLPFLMLREILQTPLIGPPHPLMSHNQLTSSQNLRHFEDNLHQETMPFQQGWEHKLPMHIVVSQPIFTRSVSPNTLNQQHLPQTPHFINMLQNGLLQNAHAQNYNIPPDYPQRNTLVHNPPSNGYSLNPSVSQNGYLINNHHYPQSNDDLLNKRPIQHNLRPQSLHSPLKLNVPSSQSLPNALGQNKVHNPINTQSNYLLERNLRNFNSPAHNHVQKPLHPQTMLSHQVNQLHRDPKLDIHGSPNYQRNRETQLANYRQINNPQQNQHLHYNALQRPLDHHHQSYHQQSLPGTNLPKLNTYLNNQQYLHQRNVPSSDVNRKNILGENYRPLPREFPSQSLSNKKIHYSYDEHSSPHSLTNGYRNPTLNNEPVTKIPDDNKKVPIYHNSPEGSRQLYYQRIPESQVSPDEEKYLTNTEQSYTRSLSSSSSSDPDKHNHYYSLPGSSHRDIHREPSYGSHTQSSSMTDTVPQSDEISNHQRSKYDESYVSNKPIKKRKSRKKKRYQTKENDDDLESHSSHQYIIKIG